ncbi:major facilitator superfamily domain-containing protein [Aspergillus desertorum]
MAVANDSTLGKGHDPQEIISEEDRGTETPEASRKAWLTLIGASLAMFVSFGWVNCIAFFQAEYETNQLKEYSQSVVSWIMSMECSLSTRYYQFVLSQSVCSGIGASLVFTPSMTAPMTFFLKKRALAGGLTIAGSSLGGIGFPWTMRVCAFIILGLLLITNFTISCNLDHHRRPFNVSQYERPMQEANHLIMCLASFFLYWGMFVPFDYIVSAGVYYGMSSAMAFNLIPILNGASFIGRTVPNILADRFGRFNMMIIMVLSTTIIILALWLPGRSRTAKIVFAALFGIGSGACIGLGPLLVMGISPIKEVGYRMGTIFAIAGISTLTSPPIGGAIVARTKNDDYDYACVFSGMNYFLALVLIILLRARVVGWKLTTKG